ncbi:hypothetical protein G3N94_03870 [Burkholderia sp. Ac-20353]|nr:hypothetical protein [Burkholderia sp. Ac-20353]
MRYRFHPLVGERLAVVRLHYVNDEPCYVIRRSNGTTVSVPAWMTELAAATSTRSHPNCRARSTSAYCRRWLSRLFCTWSCVDWRTYTQASRDR